MIESPLESKFEILGYNKKLVKSGPILFLARFIKFNGPLILMFLKSRDPVMLFWSSLKVCNDGSLSRRKPRSIKPLCNTFANKCGDMFANPNVFRCVKFENQGWENVLGSKRLLLKSKCCNEFEKMFTLGRAPVKELNDKSKIPRGDVELKIESIDTIPLKLLKLKFLNNFPTHIISLII
jgi:hypothetical protein